MFFWEIFGGIWISYWALVDERKIAEASSEGFAVNQTRHGAAADWCTLRDQKARRWVCL
jgi:hypothetical protein